MAKQTCLYGKRGLLRLAYPKYAQVSKETYSYGKRGLLIWQTRPIHMEKEAYCDLHTSGMRKCQKRPIHMAKETYVYGKRGLLLFAYLGPEVREGRETRELQICVVFLMVHRGHYCARAVLLQKGKKSGKKSKKKKRKGGNKISITVPGRSFCRTEGKKINKNSIYKNKIVLSFSATLPGMWNDNGMNTIECVLLI